MRITGCVIAKDEEKNLGKCLESMRELVDQLVVVDTGSQDRTIEIAGNYNADIHSFAWADDFSQARNYALEQAVGDWIIFLDADEYIQVEQMSLKRALASEACDALLCSIYNLNEQTKSNEFRREAVIRVFKNSIHIRYQRAVHEYLVHSQRELSRSDYRQNVKIYHNGYSKENMNQKNKYYRNIALLLKELKKDPGDGEINFYIADMYRLAQDWEKAMFHLEIALIENRFRRKIFLLSTHISIVLTMMASKKYTDGAILQAINRGRDAFPLNAELKACHGIILARKGMALEAKLLLEDSLKLFNEDKEVWSFYDEVQPEVYRLLNKGK